MALLESCGDLLDPGDTVPSVNDNMDTDDHALTASQLKQFEATDFDNVGSVDASHQYVASGSRKRKGSSSIMNPDALGSKRHVPDAATANITMPSSSSSPSTVSPVENVTSQARQVGPVVLVRPADEQSKKLLMSPAQLCTALEAAPFDSMDIQDVRVNPRKGLVAIELAHGGAAAVTELLQLRMIGPWSVVCSQPNSEKYTYGVITHIDNDADLTAMSARVQVNGNARFVRMERLNRSDAGRRVPSTSVRVVFEGSMLPKSIRIGFISYPVRKYDFPPLQCFKCQRFGHTADGCNSKMRCLVCSGPHHFKDCQNGTIKCANCGGPHKANSRECGRAPRRVEQKQPESLRVSTARAWRGSQVPHSSRSRSWVGAPQSCLPAAGSGQGVHGQELSANANFCVCRPVARSSEVMSYRSAVVSSPSVVAGPHDFLGFSSSDAVGRSSSDSDVPANCSPFSSAAFLSRLTACLTDLFSLSLDRESVAKTRSLISSAVQKHFDVVLPDVSCDALVAGSALSASSPVSLPVSSGHGSCSSPPVDAVCSAGEDLASCLGVGEFELVSDSDDTSVELATAGGGSECASSALGGISGTSFVEPTPSPVIGASRHLKKASGVEIPRVGAVGGSRAPKTGGSSSSSRVAASSTRNASRAHASSKHKK